MAEEFDPYHKWLGISPKQRPITHYRLLGLSPDETDREVIAAAADRQLAFVQTHKTGKYAELSQRILNEITAAKLCLLDPAKRKKYDKKLKAEGAPPLPPPVSAPPPVSSAPPPAPPRVSAPPPVALPPRVTMPPPPSKEVAGDAVDYAEADEENAVPPADPSAMAHEAELNRLFGKSGGTRAATRSRATTSYRARKKASPTDWVVPLAVTVGIITVILLVLMNAAD